MRALEVIMTSDPLTRVREEEHSDESREDDVCDHNGGDGRLLGKDKGPEDKNMKTNIP